MELLSDSEVIDILRKESEEYRRLEEEHKNLEEMLSEIDKRKFLSTEEEIERKRIQKQKLLKKDRMAEIIRDYKRQMFQGVIN
ncbi:MAG: DUF465 domain-containing protein [Nitrospirota bacterium]